MELYKQINEILLMGWGGSLHNVIYRPIVYKGVPVDRQQCLREAVPTIWQYLANVEARSSVVLRVWNAEPIVYSLTD